MKKTIVLALVMAVLAVAWACDKDAAAQGTAAEAAQPASEAVQPAAEAAQPAAEAAQPAAEVEVAVPAEGTHFQTLQEKVSYIIGFDMGSNLKRQQIELDTDILISALKDGLVGAEPLMTDAEMRNAMMAFQQEMMAKYKALAEKNASEGAAFLAENKTKVGVETTDDGLQYMIIQQGNGPKPTVDDTVTVNYRGTFIDGTEFDSSYERGEPATFPLQGVIPGWVEALQMMPVGSKWRLFIPAELAYGERGRAPSIGPNAMLIFEIELLGIETPETDAATVDPAVTVDPAATIDPAASDASGQ